MTSIKLNKLALFINTGCCLAGILAYSLVAPGTPTLNTACFAALGMAASFFGIKAITKRFRGTIFEKNDQAKIDPSSAAVKFLLSAPILLAIVEISALLWFGFEPRSVSAIHIIAACAAGQNAEAAFKS
ncbi:hypothetical protein [Janthinobacterium rivuli]|uniref:hypothetical protein n=1 Tax=Janthinobacterium TaxID=29580 RepID=UPI00383BF4B1